MPFATSSDSYTVVPIPVTSSCSWSIWTLYCLRQSTRSKLGSATKTQCWLKCKFLCSMVGLLKSQREECSRIGGGRVGCAGCLCTLGCEGGCLPPGRGRVIQELCEIHVHPGIAKMKNLARSCVWWVSLDADLEPKCEPVQSVSQVDPQN